MRYQKLAILVSVGDHQISAASRKDSNGADASKRSVFLSHPDREDGRERDLIIDRQLGQTRMHLEAGSVAQNARRASTLQREFQEKAPAAEEFRWRDLSFSRSTQSQERAASALRFAPGEKAAPTWRDCQVEGSICERSLSFCRDGGGFG